MEGSVANERVAQAKRDLGTSAAETIGATTTNLINSAYDYLIENRALPSSVSPTRNLDMFRKFLADSTLDVDWGSRPNNINYKSILRTGKQADYECLM